MKKLLILLFRMLFNRKSKVDNSTIDGENVKRVLYNSRTKDIFKVKMIDGDVVLYENGKKWNGRLELIYENGNLQSVGKIVNGQKEGAWKSYSEDGILEDINIYKKGRLNGKYQAFYKNGNIKEELDFVNNVENGDFKQYYESGELESQGIYIDGKLEGKLITYYKNGVIQEEANLINGRFQGKAIKNYPTGKLKMELNYLNDELEGKAVCYYEDGNIEEFYYENGELRES